MRPARGPFLAAVLVALVGWGLLALAVWQGWLGPDVDRGAGFCEASRDGFIRQPVSTWSNLGFSVAALAIGWRARHGSRMGSLTTAYVVLVAALGPASAAMHASESALGGHLDTLSMYLFAGFTAAYALSRALGLGTASFAALFVALVVACEVVAWAVGPVPVMMHAGNVAFAVLLLLTLAIENVLASRTGSPRAWGLAAVGVLVFAFVIWSQAKDGGRWCDPDSVLQGHGAWHVLAAVSAWCLYRYYDAQRDPANQLGVEPT